MMKSVFLTCLSVLLFLTSCTSTQSGITYRNPRVYNVDFSFEMVPDPNTIDRAKDLKVWIPIPREWASQKAVKIISVEPKPHARYVDPEYGNPILFWDFGKGPEQPSYKVKIKYRLESYKVHAEIDPNKIGPYDKTSKDYALYTRSEQTICITPKIKQMAQEAIGDEKNPYLQAKQIFEFVRQKMRFKIHDVERGRGIKCLLDYPVVDEKTGQEYYEGCCSQYCAFFIALCRAVGIPARSVGGWVGWAPWIKDENLRKLKYKFVTKLSPDGLAGAQPFGSLSGHGWVEFYVPNYGWIPADVQAGVFDSLNNKRLIRSKGRDIKIGLHPSSEQIEGYGSDWVLLHSGRVDGLRAAGVWNIAKVRTVKVSILHYSDPFPADGLAGYDADLFSKQQRKEVLSWPSRLAQRTLPDNLNLKQFYHDNPRAKEDREVFVCHMLHRQLGDEKFFKLIDRYIKMRQKSKQAVPTSRFQKFAEDIYGQSLDWFFKQWVNSTELPRLKLENVTVTKDKESWHVRGHLLQTGDTIFRMPVDLVFDTAKGREKLTLWMDKKYADFHFYTRNEPLKLIVDPDYEILKIQKMPPHFVWFWDIYPKFIVIYGTLGETEANKKVAEHFTSHYLGLGPEVIKSDNDVNEADLKEKCIFLIGRPQTNKIAQKFKDSFPIKFNGAKFTWQGTTYDKPTEGVAQVIDSPLGGKGIMVMYAGLSPEATLKFCDLYLYEAEASFVIFETDQELLRGDWEDYDSDLYWNLDTHQSVQLTSIQ